jgi:hypothetical protein
MLINLVGAVMVMLLPILYQNSYQEDLINMQITKVTLPGRVSYSVEQQPDNDPMYVTDTPDLVTQFSTPLMFSTIGLLAHNYLAGASFHEIRPGDLITVVTEDEEQHIYQVTRIEEYHVSPKSGDFLNLSTGEFLPESVVFYKNYAQPGKLVLQTCIEWNNNSIWGRMFITAEPYQTELAVDYYRIIRSRIAIS